MEHGVYLHQTLGVILPAPASTLDQGEWALTHLPFLYEPGPKNGFDFLNQLKRNQEKNLITKKKMIATDSHCCIAETNMTL